MTDRRAFAVITTQRTGSTLLVRSLDSSPRIYCAGEIFYGRSGIHHEEMKYPQTLIGSRLLRRATDLFWGRRRVDRYLTEFYESAGPGASAVGFKVMVSQLNRFPAVMPFLVRNGVTCLYLHRLDVFATALSYLKAQSSGVYHADKRGGPSSPVVVEANAVEFLETFRHCHADREALLSLHRAFGGHLLSYEELIDKWDAVIAAIGEALGLPKLAVKQVLPKLASTESGVRVLNEETLRQMCSRVISKGSVG